MNKLLLTSIFLLALFLRFWNLGIYPDAIDEDEMALGYNAYSIAKTGADEYGNKLPLYLESVGDYKYALYSYFATIPVSIFGLNAITTRSIAAIFGSLSVVLVYFFALEIFKNKRYGLICAFILAISPTHIHFSRVAYNNILGAFFAVFSIFMLIKYFKKPSLQRIIISFALFTISIFSYQAYRIFMPIVFILISLVYIKNPIKSSIVRGLLISFASILIVWLSLINPQSRARTQDFSILTEVPKIIENQSEDGMSGASIVSTRIFHNKYVAFGIGFVKRYLVYFDPGFLFVETSASSQRHSVPEVGLFYAIEAPLLILGILFIFIFIKSREKLIPIILVLASPVAASLVLESRSPTRSIIIVYALTFIIGIGVYYLSSIKRIGKLNLMIVMFLYFANFLYFSHQYLIHKVYHHPWNSDVGLKEMVLSVNKLESEYDNVVVSRGHYISYLFYNKIDPREFIMSSEFHPEGYSQGVRVKRYNKLVFNMPYECPKAGKVNTLYVCFGYKVPKHSRLVEVIRYKDNQPAILLVDFGKRAEKTLPDKVEYDSEEDIRFRNGIIPTDYEILWPQTN